MNRAIELPGILIDLIVRFLSIALVLFRAEMYIAIELPGKDKSER